MRAHIYIAVIISLSAILGSSAENCGWQADGALCPAGFCCSKFGYCGKTEDYCGPDDCQSQCDTSGGGVGSIISPDQFDQMLRHRNDNDCPARGFYSYHNFIAAAKSFYGFGTTGDTETRKREIAAFLGQTSHETSGGWESAPDGPYSWGYCFKEEEGNPSDYCAPSLRWPCVPGQKYYGRGPMQISYNYNYGAAGKAIGENLLGNPDLVASDATISFKTAIWYWMTPEWPIKPSSHDVITGRWYPNPADALAGRHPGYGTITNIINGGLECGHGYDPSANDRIGFYKRFCHILGVSPGPNLDCNHQLPFVPHIGAATSA